MKIRITYPETGATLTAIATLRSNNSQVVPVVTEPVPYIYELDWTAADGIWDVAVFEGADLVISEFAESASNVTVTVSSRLPTSSYSAPDNAGIAAVQAKTDNLPSDPAATSDIPAASALADAIWDEALAGHLTAGSTGTALNSASAGFVLPVMQGSVYTAVAAQSREVVIIRGDSPRITFDLGADYTGWTLKFGAKARPSDTAYVIAVKDATWTNAAAGEGYVDLTAAETAAVATLSAEIELRNGDQRLTGLKFKLTIREDVIR